ncbi:MAG TPA: transglutaminase domain-containing protein [Kiritimatiellia bacterium]|nr:transglutaminase domain-containing protein [Kiritimatiellia bacterium]
MVISATAVLAEEPGAVERYVRYGFTVRNDSDRLVPVAELWVCAPLAETSVQRTRDLKSTPAAEERTDALGNHLLRIVFSNVPPYAVRLATVEATLEMVAEPRPGGAAPERYLQPEALIEFGDEAFARQAPAVPEGTLEEKAQWIFAWVKDNLRDSGYDGTDRGALHALTERKGDCTEYATLFAALCRRAGIPARVMGGYVVDRNARLSGAAYHNWAEFHAEGRWQLADPHAGVFREGADRYVATRIFGESDSPLGTYARFRVVGDGLRAEMDR